MSINKKRLKRGRLLHVFLTLLGTMGVFVLSAQDKKWTIEPRVGYATQDFNWSISGTESGTDPNVLSELIWEDLSAMSFNLHTSYQLSKRFSFSLAGRYEQIRSGSGNDSDYATNNRTGKYYNLDFKSDVGSGYDVTLTAHYVLPRLWKLRPRVLAGYGQLGQRLYLLGVAGDITATDLRSTYQTRWSGGHAGVELSYAIARFHLAAMYKIGLHDYQAKANWNLIERFEQPVSFRQYALGVTHDVHLHAAYVFNDHLSLVLAAEHTNGYTLPGLDVAYRSDGSRPRTRLNGANYTRYAATAGLRYAF
ncbi:hypothetical protein PQ465_14125 [Sphingobacterium oryzagri]|uniref:Protochlamydia outer membrane protein domain-containing protein n=1 Tax=Sphingobacterium oryzagri TaxID=3025669 RepID=A0ABY7WJ81_9SPHI|nr:hypothetical protein [Sphingobacterium sp. KACC 22765]WDF67439.1 hypothetical protein PQ465_14125 [Sphingobacterium sp. KACC 22765]